MQYFNPDLKSDTQKLERNILPYFLFFNTMGIAILTFKFHVEL